MLNKTVLGGRLTKDPELRYTPSGVAVATFTLAVDRNYKNAQGERETDFIPHVYFRAKAELIANSLAKGNLVNTEGRIQVRTYTGQDGQKRWVTEIVGDEIYFMEPRGNRGDQQPDSSYDGNGNWSSEVNLDDDIPF